HTIDWHDPEVVRTLDVEASTVTPLLGVFGTGADIGFDTPTLGIEVLPPDDAEVLPTARWAADTTRDLLAKNEISKATTKAEVARKLEREAQKAYASGHPKRELKASYRENQLAPWGIWPPS